MPEARFGTLMRGSAPASDGGLPAEERGAGAGGERPKVSRLYNHPPHLYQQTSPE